MTGFPRNRGCDSTSGDNHFSFVHDAFTQRTAVRIYLIFSLAIVFSFVLRFPSSADPFDIFLNDDSDFESLYYDLPESFDLTAASIDDISSLPYFTGEAAESVIRFRDQLDDGQKIVDFIGSIPNLSPVQRAVLAQLVSISRHPVDGREISYRSGYFNRSGSGGLAEGSYYARMTASKRSAYDLTLLAERDTGEPRSLDLASGNIILSSHRNSIRTVLGDFRPGYGQGLVFSRYGRSYVYGANVGVNESARTGNTSFEESRYLRGAHVSVRRSMLSGDIWASVRNRDATVNDAGETETVVETGTHVSGDDHGNLREKLFGSRLKFIFRDDVSLGVSGVVSRYSPPFAEKTGERYAHYEAGRNFGHVSIDGSYSGDGMSLFFEHAVTNGDKYATIGGFRIRRQSVRAGFLARRYDAGYSAPRSGAYTSFGRTENEKGVYTALEIDAPGGIGLETSLDLARSLYRTYLENMPFSRRRLYASAGRRISGLCDGKLSFRSVRDSNDEGERWNVRLSFNEKATRKVSYGWRFSASWSSGDGEGGPLTEAGFEHKRGRFSADMSLSLFDIPSYDSRAYHYERDLPGRGRTYPLWGRGSALIAVIRFGPVSVRYLFRDSDAMKRVKEAGVQIDTIF